MCSFDAPNRNIFRFSYCSWKQVFFLLQLPHNTITRASFSRTKHLVWYNVGQYPNGSHIVLFAVSPHELKPNQSDEHAADKSRFLPVWIRMFLCFLLGKIRFLILINHRASLKWTKNKVPCAWGSVTKHNVLFSDRKTRLRWQHLSRCNKAPRCASDKMEAHNKDWQSWREYASLIPAKYEA